MCPLLYINLSCFLLRKSCVRFEFLLSGPFSAIFIFLCCVFVPGVCTWISKMESDLLCCMLWHLRAFYMYSFFQRTVRLSGEVFGRCRTPLVLTLSLTQFVCTGISFVVWLEKGFTYMRRVWKRESSNPCVTYSLVNRKAINVKPCTDSRLIGIFHCLYVPKLP